MYPRDNASFTVSAAPELMLADNIYIYMYHNDDYYYIYTILHAVTMLYIYI